VIPADLTKPEAAKHLFNTVVREKGLRVTALINNAGLGHTESFIKMPVEKMEEIIHLNTLALTTLTRLFRAEMATRGRREAEVASCPSPPSQALLLGRLLPSIALLRLLSLHLL